MESVRSRTRNGQLRMIQTAGMPLLLLSRPAQTPKHTMCANLRTALIKLEPKALILDGDSTTKSMTTSTAASSKIPQGRLSSHKMLVS